jgi:hypothetical protein
MTGTGVFAHEHEVAQIANATAPAQSASPGLSRPGSIQGSDSGLCFLTRQLRFLNQIDKCQNEKGIQKVQLQPCAWVFDFEALQVLESDSCFELFAKGREW